MCDLSDPSLNNFKVIQTNKNIQTTETIFKILNKKEFSLTSLVLENFEFCEYLEEFFVKHCLGLRSLELKYLPYDVNDPDHDPMIIASRRVLVIFQGLNPRQDLSYDMLVCELNWDC